MASTRRISLLVGVVVIAGLSLPTAASAAVTCSFDAGTGALTVAVTNGTPVAAIRRAASPSEDIQVDDASDFLTPVSCTNGPPTLTTASSITVDESGSAQGSFLILNFDNGRLEPGLGGDTGTSEIEVIFNADTTGTDQLTIDGSLESANEDFRFGAVGATEIDGNLNADGDSDDVHLENVDALTDVPGTGDDTFTGDASGPGSFTGPVPAILSALESQGNDTFRSGTGSSSYRGGLGNDTATGGSGADTFQMADGNDTFDGGGGTADFVSYSQFVSVPGVTFDLSDTAPQNTIGAGVDQVVNAESIVGSNGPDHLSGDSGNNTIFGGNSPGDTGDDVLDGAAGNDQLLGRPGNDLLIGGAGDDKLRGEEGTDTASFAVGSSAAVSFSLDFALTGVPQNTVGAGIDTLEDSTLGSDPDTNHEVENLTGSPFGGDVLTGNATANQIDVYDGLADTVDCVAAADGDVAIADEIGVDSLGGNCETTDYAPQTSIDSGPVNGATVATHTPTYGVSADEVSTFQVKVDSGSFQACAATCTVPSLANGLHTIAFRAIDTDENFHADLTPATRTVKVAVAPPPGPPQDISAPDTSVTGKAKVKTRKKKARVTFTLGSTEAGSTFACSLDGGPFAPCTSPFSAKLRRGRHTLTARATDAAGNTDQSPASFTTKIKKRKTK